MKKLLSILLLFLAFYVKAQDVAPIDTAYHTLSTYSFKYYTKDSSVWINKGAKYQTTKLVSNKRLKFLIDSLDRIKENHRDTLRAQGHTTRFDVFGQQSQNYLPKYGADSTFVKSKIYDNGSIHINGSSPDSTLTVTGGGHFTSGILANKFKKIGGIATQFLMADGSVRDTVYLPRATAFNSFVLKSDSSKLYERIANKVTSISGSSTDIQYPSAKLVYDQLALKAPTTHSHAQSQVTALSDSLLARYTKTQSDGRFAPISHTQAQFTITALADSLLARYTKSQSDNRFAPLSHTQAQTTITALSDSLLARYTKTQSDGRFQPKAAILTNIADSLLARYTKTQANALFQSKGNYVALADSSGGGAGKYASGKALQTHAALSASTNTSGHLSSTDWNTFNGKAPASGSANYIHNQYDAPQSYANMWISGTGVFGSTFRTSLPITVHSDGMAIMNTDVSNWSIIRNTAGTGASNISLFTGQGETLLLNHNKSAVFASTVSATQYQSTIATGTPPLTVASTTLVSNLNAERWAGYQYGGGYSSGLISYVMIYNGSTGKFEALSLSDLNTNLGVTTGSGTANYLTQWTGTHALGNSPLFLDGAFVVFAGYGANFTGTNRQLNIENSGLYAGYFGPAYNSSSDNIIRFKDYNSSEYGRFSADGSFSVGTINSGGYKMYVNGSIFGNGTATFVSTLTSNADLYVKNGSGIRLYNPANTDWSYLGYNANSETNFNNTVYLKNAGGVNALYPSSTNATDLGTSSLLWKNIYYTGQLNSTIATGNPPFVVASTTLVSNLNADRWAGYQYGGGYSSGLVSYVMIYNGSTGKFEALTLSGLNTSLGTTTGSGTANYIPKWKTGTTFEDSPMSIDGNFVMFASGAQFTGTNRQVIIENTGLYAGFFSPAYNSTSDNIIKFKDYNSSEYARFDASGNFAIGTTNASGYKAYINGTAYIATSVTTPTINLVTGAGVNKVWQCTNATTGAGQWASMATSQTWKGSWNASSNSPTLADGTGTAGDTYTVSVGATRDLGSGSIAWPTNGSAVYNGSIWQMLPAPTISGAALTKTDDTNVTLTLGGSPSTALVNAASITVGWTGTLADTRITSASNWNTAYNQTRQWDGGATGLVAATGRSSLGLGNAVTANFGTTTGTIAYGDHNHTGVYDPLGIGHSEATAHVSAHESTFNHSNYNTAFGWGNWAANFGTTAGKIAEGNHSHDYSAIYDAIGAASTSVSTHESDYNHVNYNTAYSERMRWDGGSTGLVVNTAWTSLGLGTAAGKSVGTGSTQVAAGDHNHYMVYQPYSSVLTDTEQAFTTVLNNKLTGIAAGAEVNVNADWNAVSGDAQILNKPTLLALGDTHTTAAYGDHTHSGYATTASLSNYLPLSGGTLTGTLYGTSASFSSTVTASNTILSDIRLKKDIKPIEWINLENLNKVNWVQYISRNDPESRQRYGVEAQELEKILPQFVFTASDEMKTKSVNYTDLLIAKVAHMEMEKKQTDDTIKSLEERLKKLEDMFKPGLKQGPEFIMQNTSQP